MTITSILYFLCPLVDFKTVLVLLHILLKLLINLTDTLAFLAECTVKKTVNCKNCLLSEVSCVSVTGLQFAPSSFGVGEVQDLVLLKAEFPAQLPLQGCQAPHLP